VRSPAPRAGSVKRMERERIDWAAGAWTREPAATRVDGDALVVAAFEGSDFWRTTHYGFIHDDGHALLGEWPADAAIEVTFDASSLTALYDQAGLMLWAGPDQWIKTGLELSDGVLHLGAVVTNGVSDWSLAPVPEWAGQLVTMRASRAGGAGDAVVLRARTSTSGWRTVRVAPFTSGEASAGPLVCAPMRGDLEVRFTRWELAPVDVDLHEDPPIA
jgi:regulation of enolase protein 1 (concanavalin A-like superfamily)